jgi:hypothetical protein
MIHRAILRALMVSSFALTTVGAQDIPELRLKLNTGDGSPIDGALVALLDTRDSVVIEGLTSFAGTRLLHAPPGSYRLRVRRIGYLPFVSKEFSLVRSQEMTIHVESPRVMLESIVVNSRSQCKRNDPNSADLAIVWDEIDKALRSTELTVKDLRGIGEARVYRRTLDSAGVVIFGDSSVFEIKSQRPFGAVNPDSLARGGYVLGGLTDGWTYFGPDEAVLRSDQFASTHCFRLVRDAAHPGQIGVLFEPAPRRIVADIAGVIWVDEATSELKHMQFRFVNAGPFSQFDAGGFTRFRRVASGAWIVDEWKLSAPRLEVRQLNAFRSHLVVTGRYDNGGGIIEPRR